MGEIQRGSQGEGPGDQPLSWSEAERRGGAWSAAECAGDARRGGNPSNTHHPNTKTKTPNNHQQNPRNPIIHVTRGSDYTPRRAPVDYLPPQHANQRPKTQTTQPIFFAEIRVETLIAEFQSSRNDRLCRICNTRCTTSSKLCALPTRDPVASGRSANSASSHALFITIEDLLSFTAKSLIDCQNLYTPSVDLDLPLR